MNIGFDLDGIFIPDYSGKGNLKKYLEARVNFFKPIFNLEKLSKEHKIFLITGRPGCDLISTKKWVDEYLPNVTLNHNLGDLDNALEHKIQAIKNNNIKVFFESDESQVNEMRKILDDVKIILWKDFVLNSIENIIGE